MFNRIFKTLFGVPGRCGLGALALTFAILFPAVQVAGQGNNTFPSPAEVLQGRQFSSGQQRDIFFLRAIHDHYAANWEPLLEANINEQQYIQMPSRMLQFIQALGAAMHGIDDPASITNLATVTSDRKFFTNINSYHPEILQAAAEALIALGPKGRAALAESFSLTHYRDDSESLEVLAKTIGTVHPDDAGLAEALAATAFDFSTTNGGIYPRCTKEMVQNLLYLPSGIDYVRQHLTTNNIFIDPVRFQSVVDGIAAVQATALKTNLVVLAPVVKDKLISLRTHPGPYRDAVEDLQSRLQTAIDSMGGMKPKAR